MIDFIPDPGFIIDIADSVAMWMAAFGSGFYLHKKSAINYRERWQKSLKIIEQEKLNTKELEATTPEPQPKPSSTFVPAGHYKEFERMAVDSRIKLERARLSNGLPPKDPMINTGLYSVIAAERIKLGWDWHQEDYGWYWQATADQKKIKAAKQREVDDAYNKGYREASRRDYSHHSNGFDDYYRRLMEAPPFPKKRKYY